MTFEQRSSALPAEAGPIPGPTEPGAGGAGPTPVQLRLQILSTEHWSLLASRSLAWNESFSRAGMYLSTLSGAMVALALVAGLDKTGDAFFLFAIVLLPVVLFVGVATMFRLGSANYHDALCVTGMNRIRGAYLQIAPELEPLFVMGVHDDPIGIQKTMAVPPQLNPWVHIFAATPFLITVLNAVVVGAIVAIVALRIGAATVVVLGVAMVAFLISMVVQARFARGNVQQVRGLMRPMFPTPSAGDRPVE